MLEFVKKWFRNGLAIILWINLIGSVIVFGVSLAKSMDSIGGFFLGVIIGLAFGVITNIIGGGLIATILSIDDNLEKLVNRNSDGDTPEVTAKETPKTTSENAKMDPNYLL